MAQKQVVADGNGGEDQKDGFREKWLGLDDEGKYTMLTEIQKAQAGSDRKATALAQEVEALKARLNESDVAVIGEAEKIAAIRTREALVDRKAAMIERALEGGLDPAIAVQFAQTENPDQLFDDVAGEVERVASEKVEARLASGGNAMEFSQLVTRMSQKEMSRIPERILRKALGVSDG